MRIIVIVPDREYQTKTCHKGVHVVLRPINSAATATIRHNLYLIAIFVNDIFKQFINNALQIILNSDFDKIIIFQGI